MADAHVHRTQDRRRANLARAAALGAAAMLTAGLATGCGGPSGSDAAGAKPASVTAATALDPSVPDRITIPSIKVDAPLGSVGLQSDGSLETPPFGSPMEASWYREGPTPGERGPAIIAGHMDTAKVSEAVFYKLDRLKKNAEIDVERNDGSTAVFVVDSVDTFKKNAFPDAKVYGGTADAQLRLITCGGNLTEDRHWDSNVVVFAHLKGKQSAPA